MAAGFVAKQFLNFTAPKYQMGSKIRFVGPKSGVRVGPYLSQGVKASPVTVKKLDPWTRKRGYPSTPVSNPWTSGVLTTSFPMQNHIKKNNGNIGTTNFTLSITKRRYCTKTNEDEGKKVAENNKKETGSVVEDAKKGVEDAKKGVEEVKSSVQDAVKSVSGAFSGLDQKSVTASLKEPLDLLKFDESRLGLASAHQFYVRSGYFITALGILALVVAPTPAAFVVNSALAVLLPYHSHVGVKQIIDDYVPNDLVFIAKVSLTVLTFITVVGLLTLAYQGVGVLGVLGQLWTIPALQF